MLVTSYTVPILLPYFSPSHSFTDATFWDFSFEEHGLRDLPAMLSRALHLSGASSLSYVGHSMGATAFFVMAHEHPDWTSTGGFVEQALLLAPVAVIGWVSSARAFRAFFFLRIPCTLR